MLWKVSYNYLIDIKGVKDAPRIIKLHKIIRNPEFASEPMGDEYY